MLETLPGGFRNRVDGLSPASWENQAQKYRIEKYWSVVYKIHGSIHQVLLITTSPYSINTNQVPLITYIIIVISFTLFV